MNLHGSRTNHTSKLRLKKGDKHMKAHKDMILKYLQTHKRGITRMQALEKFGCINLPGRIYDLKDEGHKIVTNMIEVENRYGEISRIAQYRLIER